MDFYRPPTTLGTLEALGHICRAMRAMGFYPKGHPARRSGVIRAYTSLKELLDGNTLQLNCGRTGFSFPDGESLRDPSGQTTILAYELFIRRVQKITFQHDVYQEDLLELLKIITMIPDVVQQGGGVEKMMATHGVRSIWVNEFDLSKLHNKRKVIEKSGVVPEGLDVYEPGEDGSAPASALLNALPQDDEPLPESRLQALLAKMAECYDADSYHLLAVQALECSERIIAGRESHLVLALIEMFAAHINDSERDDAVRLCAEESMKKLAVQGDVVSLVLSRAGAWQRMSTNAFFKLIQAGGESAVTMAIEEMAATDSLKTRKMISTTLGQLGEGAVPSLLALMDDPRWFIIRNICAILGMIGSCSAVPELIKCLGHYDLRVRKEAVRSLAQLNSLEAENAIIDVLRGSDADLQPQAVASLGGMKSRRALVELMRIVFAKDLFLKSITLKTEALAAIAAIGDRQVLSYLSPLLNERYLLAAAKGRQFKSALQSCINRLEEKS